MTVDQVAIAFSRSCHTARHHGAAVPECRTLCNSSYQLHMTHRWRLFHNELEPMGRRLRTAVPPWTVFGNVTYRPVETPTHWAVDGYVLDARFYTPNALRHRLAALEPAMSPAASQGASPAGASV
jgi:hypothetical protein